MTKIALLVTILGLALPNSLALAASKKSYGCKKDEYGATVKMFNRELGFSSVEECEQQLETLANGTADSVICGCSADHAPAGMFLALMGAAVGINQTNMNLECFKLEDNQLNRVRFITFDIIRKVEPAKNGQPSHYVQFNDRIEACKRAEKRLYIEMNSPIPMPNERNPS